MVQSHKPPKCVMCCRSTFTPLLGNRAIKRLLLSLSQCGPRIERLCWVFPSASGSGYAVLIGFYRDRCDSSWPQLQPPSVAVLRRAAQGIELHVWDHPRLEMTLVQPYGWRWNNYLRVSDVFYPISAQHFFLAGFCVICPTACAHIQINKCAQCFRDNDCNDSACF